MTTAVAAPLPGEVRDVLEGIAGFVKTEVITGHERHADGLDEPRRRYRDDGAFSDDVVGLIRDVGTASARAGYFNLGDRLARRRRGSSHNIEAHEARRLAVAGLGALSARPDRDRLD